MKFISGHSGVLLYAIVFSLLQHSDLAASFQEALPEHALFRIGTGRVCVEAGVSDCAITDDCTTLIALSTKGLIARWNMHSGRELGRRLYTSDRTTRITLSPNGQFFCVSSSDGRFQLRECRTGGLIREFESSPSSFGQFLQCGEFFVVYSPSGIQLYIAATGASYPERGSRDEKGRIRIGGSQKASEIGWIDVSANGRLAMRARARQISIWDLNSGSLLRELRPQGEWVEKEGGSLKCLAYSRDGKYLAAQNDYGRILLFDATDGTQLRTLRESGAELCGFIGSDSKSLIAWSARWLYCWDLQTGQSRFASFTIDERISCVAASPDAGLIAVGTQLGSLMRFDATLGASPPKDFVTANPYRRSRFLDGGNRIAASIQEGECDYESARVVRYWNGHTGNAIDDSMGFCTSLNRISERGTRCIRLSGREVVVAEQHNEWAKPERYLDENGYVHPLALSPDGKVCATAQSREPIPEIRPRHFEWRIQIRKTETGELLREIATLHNPIDRFWFSPDCRTILGWYQTGAEGLFSTGMPLQLWDVASGKSLSGFESDSTRIGAFAFSTNGRFLASTECRNQPFIRLREVFTGRDCIQIRDEPDFHGGISFFPHRRYLAYGQRGGMICVRDIRADQVVLKLSGHNGRVNSLDFAPDGRRLLSSSEDGTMLVWDVAKLVEASTTPPVPGKSGEELIQILKGPDASKAFAAIHQLAEMGNQVLKPLEKEVVAALQAAKQNAIGREQIDNWITDLESRDFKARQAATDRLRENGDHAEASLRSALKKSPPLETRRRIEQLLTSIESGTPLSPAVVFAIRAVEVLEQIGTSQSCAVLERLASNGVDARIQQEAKLSLQQLKQRAATSQQGKVR